MLLKDKVAVIYGAGGAIGGAAARAFAREGARLFLAGRTLSKVEAVADEIDAAGGRAEAAEVDVIEPQAVESHLQALMHKAGQLDICFNAVWIHGELQGTPLTEMSCEDFSLPVLTGIKTHFLTATAAARHMLPRHSGVILTLSSSSAWLSGRERRYHLTGGFSTACAAIEALTRSLAGELGPHGIRVVCLRPEAIPETWREARPGDRTLEQARYYLENGTALGRLPTLSEVANAAVFAASDQASALTGAVLNLTCGSIMD